MLKRIRGTVIYFYQSRISKVLAPVIVAALTLLLFLSGSVRAYASNIDIEDISSSLSFGNGNPGYNVRHISTEQFTLSGSTRYRMRFSIEVYFNLVYSYDPYYDYIGLVSFQFSPVVQLGYNQTNSNFITASLVDIVNDYEDLDISFTEPSNQTVNGIPCLSLGNLQFNKLIHGPLSHSGYYTAGLIYEVVVGTSNPLNTIQNMSYSASVNLKRLYRTKNPSLVLSDIAYLDTDIYNELIRQSSFLEVDLDSKLDDIIEAIESNNVSNILLYDNSGVSESIADINDNYNSVQATADAAVDDAVHSYDNQLEEVEDIDLSSFFNTQRYGLSFWRSVGEFILDSANLGYIATGLIVVTVINLFVFLLRL